MAKRRLLKKDIGYIAGDLFTEALICKLLVPGIDKAKADALMTRILDLQDEFIRRTNHTEGKENGTRVKDYFRKLKEDFQKEVDAIDAEIEKISHDKIKHVEEVKEAPKAKKETKTAEAKPKAKPAAKKEKTDKPAAKKETASKPKAKPKADKE